MNSHDTPGWNSWRSMKERCHNATSSNYYKYGARGIKVCAWWHHFHNFIDDMGLQPEGMSIDRIDNDGDYTKANCKWSTPKEQANNRRERIDTIYLTMNGISKTTYEWAEEYGVSSSLIRSRIRSTGWAAEKILTTPSRKRSYHE